MRISLDIPPNVAKQLRSGDADRRWLQAECNLSEYKAKVYSHLYKHGEIEECFEYEILKSVLLPDIHYPRHDRPSVKAVNDFIKWYKPDRIVYMGDQVCLDMISSFNKSKLKLIETERIALEYEGFDREILKVHEDICPDAERIFLYGNHEQRATWFVEQVPSVEGLVEIENVLKLKQRGYQIIPHNHVYRIGKLRVIHGFYWNIYHARKHCDAFESNVCYGHVHNLQTFTKISPVDRKDYHMATSLPCLSTLNPDYNENKPTRFVNGFGIVETSIETGNFNLYPIVINNGIFIFGGQIFDGTA